MPPTGVSSAPSKKIEGQFCYALSHHYDKPCDQAGENCPLRDSMESGEPNRVLHVHHTSAGREHVEVEVVPVRNEAGNTIYYMETMHSLRHARDGDEDREMVGYSRPFNRMLELAKRVAAKESSVLLLGESGTGKELVAHAIHDMSPRASAPFVALECSGLTETLFESEMFGYEKGAFTGAVGRKIGLVEAVRGGTLFLDEVGDIPLSLQVKLLRLMEAGTYRRIGGIEPLRADFRLVAATHRDLAEMVQRRNLPPGSLFPHQRLPYPAAAAAGTDGRFADAGKKSASTSGTGATNHAQRRIHVHADAARLSRQCARTAQHTGTSLDHGGRQYNPAATPLSGHNEKRTESVL